MLSFIHTITNPQAIISTFGLIGVIVIIFLETGFFFGFFFPGDSLLFTAGLLASQGYMNVALLFLGAFVAAVLGDSVGYSFGRKVGPSMFTREDSVLFNKKHIARAQHFYEIYGAKVLILARFMPVVRTFAPIVAGIGNMKYRTFLVYNVLGGLLWTGLMVGLGYGFGATLTKMGIDPDKYLLPVIGLIIVISILPAIREILKKKPVV
ncbi:MAG: rane protein [Candidatus Parcubacteria bacterium]|nr:rane protein [Candidatus Parcubacteria bacterium]